jgi:hypothetical protein
MVNIPLGSLALAGVILGGTMTSAGWWVAELLCMLSEHPSLPSLPVRAPLVVCPP